MSNLALKKESNGVWVQLLSKHTYHYQVHEYKYFVTQLWFILHIYLYVIGCFEIESNQNMYFRISNQIDKKLTTKWCQQFVNWQWTIDHKWSLVMSTVNIKLTSTVGILLMLHINMDLTIQLDFNLMLPNLIYVREI